MWSGELSDKHTAAVYVFATMEEEIVDFNVVVRQQFFRTSSGIALKFQRPG